MHIRRIENKLGIHSSPTCEIQYTDTPAILIGKRRFGLLRHSMQLMNGARLAVGAQALVYHAFAPLFIIALGTIGLTTFLPNQKLDKLAAWIAEIESRTGLTAILLIGLVVYWLARLLIMRGDFLALVA